MCEGESLTAIGADLTPQLVLAERFELTAPTQWTVRLREGVRRAVRLIEQPAFTDVLVDQVSVTPADLETDAALDAWLIRNIGIGGFHAAGACKMGPSSDPLAVVDSRLRVHGIAGLRVVDAGVMPLITSGNTNSPTLMLAEKAAQWIAEDAKPA